VEQVGRWHGGKNMAEHLGHLIRAQMTQMILLSSPTVLLRLDRMRAGARPQRGGKEWVDEGLKHVPGVVDERLKHAPRYQAPVDVLDSAFEIARQRTR
jgi:hypothetical protein